MLLDRCGFNVDCSQTALENGAHTAHISPGRPLFLKSKPTSCATLEGKVNRILASESTGRNSSYCRRMATWN